MSGRPEAGGVSLGIKEELENEGFEGDEKGDFGAAVLVGTREELDKARQRLETGGKVKNLETYLKMHRGEPAVPANHVFKGQAQLLKEMRFCLEVTIIEKKFNLYYLDKQRNIMKTIIDTDKIKEISDIPIGIASRRKAIEKKLEEFGFEPLEPNMTLNFLISVQNNIKWHKEQQALEEKTQVKKDFNF